MACNFLWFSERFASKVIFDRISEIVLVVAEVSLVAPAESEH